MITTIVKCDKCRRTQVFENTFISEAHLLDYLKEHGWKTGQRHTCPSCVEDSELKREKYLSRKV